MAQFDVHKNQNPKASGLIPFVLDIQNDLLADLATTVAIPLYVGGAATRGITRLTPEVSVNGQTYLLLTPELAGIPRKALGPVVGNLADCRDDIMGAVDFLLAGV